ncbi:Acetylcholine receptor subunit alpha [Intoshia linei]|uniref:Acetylcholine receptor subunit alpha n=1 Tax=Intoshia linei TaxID=1819745 RepID=A0A177BBU3_9BILA|nr:Acetylcholine receptor subunit alpha [Intoshia linei]
MILFTLKKTPNIKTGKFPYEMLYRKTMKFGSWTYDGSKINLTKKADVIDRSTYQESGEWLIVETPVTRNVIKYECCPEEYIDITFIIHIRRRALYYGFNIIVPCALISSLTMIMFLLPQDSGEKVSLGVTILLSLSVFSLIVADSVPTTSMSVPIVGVYFQTVMLMCTVSVVMAIFILNLHHRKPTMYIMPNWIRIVVCEWLAWILHMHRPGKDLSREFLLRKSKIRKLASQKPFSVSLISNITNMDNAIPQNDYLLYDTQANQAFKFHSTTESIIKKELLEILNEIRFITHKIKDGDQSDEEINDWKFAAMVIDRFCLITFTLMTIFTTLGCVLSGQHEENLIDEVIIRRKYNSLARPVSREEDALVVKFGITLQQIIALDEKSEMLHTNLWLNYEWHDYKLSWNETEYGNVTSIRLPAKLIWTPDILMYNRDISFNSKLKNKHLPNVASCSKPIPIPKRRQNDVFITTSDSSFDDDLYVSPEIFNGEDNKTGIVTGPQLKHIFMSKNFKKSLNKNGLHAWNSLKQNDPLVSSDTLIPRPLHIKLDLAKQFLNCIQKSKGINPILKQILPFSEAKIIAGIVTGSRADEDIDSKFPTNIVVYSDGRCNWVPPGLYISSCSIDITWFPFDDQICYMKFGSWSYDGGKINLIKKSDTVDISAYQESGEWLLIDVPAMRHVKKYDCCPEQYIDITFKIHIRRRALYYGFNLIIPCALISSLTMMVFLLPPDSGEKVSLGVTILLSLSVFSLIVAESVPSTSMSVPILGIYFQSVRILICDWMACILGLTRPGKDLSRQFLLRKSKMRNLESRSQFSLSLISNIKDIDNAIPLNEIPRSSPWNQNQNAMYNIKNELLSILNELRYITHKVKDNDQIEEEVHDWKFAAMVIDRFCLVLFAALTIFTTMGCFLSVPHIT